MKYKTKLQIAAAVATTTTTTITKATSRQQFITNICHLLLPFLFHVLHHAIRRKTKPNPIIFFYLAVLITILLTLLICIVHDNKMAATEMKT